MEETVWGSLFFKTTIDKLPQKVYTEETLLYTYKEEVSVPPLGMVDDVLTVQKSGATSAAINNAVNSFFEQKKAKVISKEMYSNSCR